VSSMSRESVLTGVLTIEPASTSDLYDRAGYAALAEVGMISYHEFRAQLEKLQAAGIVESEEGTDGSTLWSLTSESAGEE
jgi:hypothetical protein